MMWEWDQPVPEAFGEPSVRIDQATFRKQLFELNSFKDLTVVAGNGAEFKCHRVIFAAQSPVLAAMVSPSSGMLESQTGRVVLRHNSEEGVKLLLQYLYGFDVFSGILTCEVAVELFKMAHQYDLTQLVSHLRGLLIEKGVDWWSPDNILELYFHVKNIDGFGPLRSGLLNIMKRMRPLELRACERYEGLSREEVENLVWELFEAMRDSQGRGQGWRPNLGAHPFTPQPRRGVVGMVGSRIGGRHGRVCPWND